MSFSASKLPRQRVSLEEKLKDDKQWAKDIIDFLCVYADEFSNSSYDDYNRKLSNYMLYNNIINQEDFERECNPLGIEVGQFKDEIMPYNKTYNKIQVLLGEELKRKMDFRAVIVNAEGIKEKENMRTKLLREYIEYEIEKEKNKIIKQFQQSNPPPDASQVTDQQQAQQMMQDYQMQMQSEVDKVLNPAEIDKYMATEYQEAREILVQKILNFLIRDLNIAEKKNDAFKHALIAGEELTWVGIVNGEPTVKLCNPLNTFWYKSPEEKYIQKGEFAGTKVRMSIADIFNEYEEDLSDEDKEKLECNRGGGVTGIRSDLIGPQMKYFNESVEYTYQQSSIGEEGSYGYSDGDDWEVVHCEWVSRAKVGFLTYVNEEGEENTDMVSEYFPIPEGSKKTKVTGLNGNDKSIYVFPNGDTLEWKWIPEVWEGTRIGSDIYVNIRKKSVQFRSLDNPFDVKLGYHGLVYNNMNAPSQSLMDRMKPYQYLYFVIFHKLKKLIARDRGQVFSFDLSMVDEQLGLEKTLYYLEEMDLDLYNPLMNADSPGAHHRGKITGSTSRSNMQHVAGYIELLRAIDIEIGEAAGVTKQREGQVGHYETVGNAQQSIMQSSHITELFFHLHAKHWEKVMDSLVQVTQHAWKGKNIVKQFVLDDLSREVLKLSGDELYNNDFGIYVSNSIQDAELIDTLKQMALPILQNEGKITDIIKIYKSLSSSELEREFQKQERERQKLQQQQQEALRQTEEMKIQKAAEMQEKQFQHEKELKQMELEARRVEAEIDVFKFQQDLDVNNNGVPDPLEIEKLRTERDYNDKKLEQEKKIHEDRMKIEKEKIQVQKSKNNNKK